MDREALRHVLRPISGQQPLEKEDTWVGGAGGTGARGGTGEPERPMGHRSWVTMPLATLNLFSTSQLLERRGGQMVGGAGGPREGVWAFALRPQQLE